MFVIRKVGPTCGRLLHKFKLVLHGKKIHDIGLNQDISGADLPRTL
jgi:hypothetical protein